MKNKAPLLLALLMAASLSGGLASCQKAPSESSGTSLVPDDEEYIVKFNYNYDGTVIKKTVLAGQTVTLPENPSRVGYSFEGWFKDYRQDCEDRFDPSQPILSDLTVYAKWAQDLSVHIVTLNFNGIQRDQETLTVNHGSAMDEPDDPEYPDDTMVFTGWYTDAQCTQLFDFSTKITTDITLFAGWRLAKATVTFDLNYNGAPAPTSVTTDLDQPLAEPNTPTRDHYSFVGWFDRRAQGNQFDFSTPITGDLTLYAQWVESEFLVTFDLNGATISDDTSNEVYIAKGTSAESYAEELAGKLVYEGHDFKGWFTAKYDANTDEDATEGKEKANLSSITLKTTAYAGWALSTYTVSFDLAYEGAAGAPASQSVKFGKTAEKPTDPTRENYLFGGWYTDSALTNQFTFDMTVSSDLHLYAKWIEDTHHDNLTVTYYLDTTVYAAKEIAFNSAASSNAPTDPTKEAAIFGGWYTDSAFTTKFNMNANLTESLSVYGKFLNRYIMEAEGTNLAGKHGQGSSTNSYEQSMIHSYVLIKNGAPGIDNVSNGYFMRELYYRGAYLEFEIESSKAVDDAVLYLRASSECKQFVETRTVDGVLYNYLSETDFKIFVNTDWNLAGEAPNTYLKYGGLLLPFPNLDNANDLDDEKTPFTNILISNSIHLDKGMNYITFYVDNSYDYGGTFNAAAPIIDCIHVYSDATLKFTDYEYYKKEGVWGKF